MKLEQIYTKCLAQGAYYIESEGEVAVIDPLRETFPYLDRAKKDGAQIKYIFETHFHADFVSGHVDLAKDTGATIVFGPEANPSFEFHSAKDGEVFVLGALTITVLHTPGHTMESTCYLLKDASGKEIAVFTGDTLFIGDVGRPDLAQKSDDMTKEDLAGILYDSLRSKLIPLSDEVIVYPAHGAGSACGKNMSKETYSTIGEQKRNNYALNEDLKKEDFIRELIDGLLPPPNYFGMNVALNKGGYERINEVIERGLNPLSTAEFTEAVSQDDVVVLDTRKAQKYADCHVPNSIFIGLDGQFAPWVGALIPDISRKIILIIENGREEEAVRRLARVGYDQVLGYLDGGFESWVVSGADCGKVDRISVDDFLRLQLSDETVVDVRKPGEFESAHIEDALLLPLDFINDTLSEFPKDKALILHCAGGYRSMIAASILKKNGIHDLKDIIGGFNAIPDTSGIIRSTVCDKK